jgi:bifunctional DNA-binding transcriptional regulator/antitoxin component of YhaV-PrlF toxin-antitoxin module
MRWVIKVTRTVNQFRITLPGTFCKTHDISEADYMVIDDREPDKITIGRLEHGKKSAAKGK